MRRILSAILVICVICLCGAIPAFAAENRNFAVSVNYRETAQAAYYDVTVSTDFVAAGIEGKLCNDRALVFESAAISSSIASKNEIASSVKEGNDGVSFILLGDVSGGTSGNWITFSFRLAEPGTGIVQFSLADRKASSLKGKALIVPAGTAQANLSWINGDVNRDGNVNIKDLVRIKKHFSGQLTESEYSPLNANCDRNAILDANDLVALRALLLHRN